MKQPGVRLAGLCSQSPNNLSKQKGDCKQFSYRTPSSTKDILGPMRRSQISGLFRLRRLPPKLTDDRQFKSKPQCDNLTLNAYLQELKRTSTFSMEDGHRRNCFQTRTSCRNAKSSDQKLLHRLDIHITTICVLAGAATTFRK